jgi:hypothetical protein
MARVLIATQAWGWVVDQAGNPLAGQTVTIRKTDGTAATHYSAITGGTSSTSVLTTAANGTLPRYIDEDTYDVTISGVTRRVEAVAGAPVRVLSEAPLNVEYPEYGAGPSQTAAQNSTAIAAALAAVPAAGGDVLIPHGLSYDTTITLTDGVRLLGAGAQQRWRSSASGTKLTYTGTGQAVRIANPSTGTREAIELHNLRFDGTTRTGSVDGLVIDGLAGDATKYVEGVKLIDCAFTNFPRYQARLDGLLIDIIFERCALNNVGVPNSFDLVHAVQSGDPNEVVTQLSFNECLLAQYGTEASSGAGAWCYRGDAANVRFVGGTATTNGQAGGSGIWVAGASGALTLIGTHLEGINTSLTGIGIRRSGVSGSFIAPSYCAAFDIGVQIGDPTAAATGAVDTTIAGMVGGNNTDIQIRNGGSRRGTKILATGESTGNPPTVSDLRRTTDGEWELYWLHPRGAIVMPRVAAASAPNSSLYTSTVDGKLYFKDNSGTSNVLY